jgi:hypothetical protein
MSSLKSMNLKITCGPGPNGRKKHASIISLLARINSLQGGVMLNRKFPARWRREFRRKVPQYQRVGQIILIKPARS